VVELAAGGDDVRARRQQRAHLVQAAGGGHVQHAVSAKRQDLVPVGRREHPGGRHPAQVAGVLPRLGGRRDVHPGQFKTGVLDDAAQRAGADVPGRPLDHP
jgi:hypothetical protein